MKKENEQTFYGGQAVIEGVMMRGKTMYAMAVRNSNTKEIVMHEEFFSKKKNLSFLKLPLVRGCVSFVSSMYIGMKIITKSAEMSGLEDFDEEPTKFEKYLTEKFGNEKINNFIIGFSVVLSIIMSISLFILLPAFIGTLFNPLIGSNLWVLSIIEGIIRICIFLLYIYIISKLDDIQRLFKYHGAEHKTINCYEQGKKLTPENVAACSRLHKRCGTSFLLIVMVVSMVTFMFLRADTVLLRTAYRLILLPFVAGISYEVVKWAGKTDNKFVEIISAPGMALQKWTTKEPDRDQIEVAIKSLEMVLKYEENKEE